VIFSKRKALLLIIIGISIFLSIFFLKVKKEMIDFEVNYKAGERVSLGETLYRIEDGHYQFKYSPFSALLYLPLSFFPLPVAKAIWYFIIIISFCFIIYIARYHLLCIKNKFLLLTVLPPLILIKFFLRELQLGQVNVLITMILIFMVWCLISEENVSKSSKICWAGVLWGLATALKPYALIFFFYFMIKKKWKSLNFGLVFLVFFLFIPTLFYGFNGNIKVLQEWVSTLSRSTPTLLDSQDNISILGFFMKWTGSQKISFYAFFGVMISLAILLLILVIKGKWKKDAPVLDCSILLILIPLISPLGWDYTLLMSVLGIMIILAHFFDYSKFWRGFLILNLSVIAFSLYDFLGKELYSKFMSWYVITINFFILIGYLAFLRFKRIC